MAPDLRELLGHLLFHAQEPLVAQGLLVTEASPSQSDTPHSVGLLWKSDQPDAETSTWQHTTLMTDIHPPAGFGHAIPASERPQTHVLDFAATGIGFRHLLLGYVPTCFLLPCICLCGEHAASFQQSNERCDASSNYMFILCVMFQFFRIQPGISNGLYIVLVWWSRYFMGYKKLILTLMQPRNEG
jgi:hypothetical protein